MNCPNTLAFDISTPPPAPGKSLCIPLDVLPEWLERHGYEVIDYDNGFIVMAATTLKYIIRDMLATAEARPGTPIRRKLSNGLQVGVLVTANGVYKFQISRSGQTWPGEAEWSVLRRSMPEGYVLPTDFKRARSRGRNYFYAHIQRVQMPLLEAQHE